jgi:outer membrane PBP1 activator LpoA protein
VTESAVVKIGLLLPLSGPEAEIGRQLRDAALLGLFDKRKSLHRRQLIRDVELLIRDTAGQPSQTRKATESLLAEGSSLIIGPLRAENVQVVKEVLKRQRANTTVLAFSNDQRVAGDNIFLFGFRPSEQATRIANYALDQKIQHFASIAPQSEYARAVVRDFSHTVKGAGFSLQPVNFFAEGGMPPPPVLQRILSNAVEWGDKRKAIFLPVTGASLAQVAASIMTYEDINPAYVKLLGTGLWDDDSLMGIRALQGAWFATSNPELSRRFNRQFYRTYNYQPARLASLAYDAVALTATLALNAGAPALDSDSLRLQSGFNGPANGLFRFTPEGLTERGLAIVEITPRGMQVIDPAPTSF